MQLFIITKGACVCLVVTMPTVRNLAVLALFGSLLAYGVGVFVYVICGFLSFAAGYTWHFLAESFSRFLFFLPDTHWVSLKQKIPVSRGLVEVIPFLPGIHILID